MIPRQFLPFIWIGSFVVCTWIPIDFQDSNIKQSVPRVLVELLLVAELANVAFKVSRSDSSDSSRTLEESSQWIRGGLSQGLPGSLSQGLPGALSHGLAGRLSQGLLGGLSHGLELDYWTDFWLNFWLVFGLDYWPNFFYLDLLSLVVLGLLFSEDLSVDFLNFLVDSKIYHRLDL